MTDFNGVKAAAAIEKLNGTSMDGKKVIVELSKPKKSLDPNLDNSSMGPSINYVTSFSRFFYPLSMLPLFTTKCH